jgi:hypothetical protein
MFKHSLVGSFVALVLMTGCSHQVLKSSTPESCVYTDVAGLPCTHQVASGLAYSLPKGQVLLAASRRPITVADTIEALKAVAAAKQAVAKSMKALSDAQSARAKNLATPGTSDSQKAQDDAAVATAAAGLEGDKAALQTAEAVLADMQGGAGKYIEVATVVQLPVAPDPTSRYVANLSHLISRDDNFKLSVVNGLLTTTDTSSADQTGAVLVKLADAAVSIATLVAGGVPLIPSGPVPAEAPPKPKLPCEYNIATAFNPSNPSEVETVKKELAKRAPHFEIAVDNPDVQLQKQLIRRDKTLVPGLVYRTAINVTVSIAPKSDALTTEECPLQRLVAAQSLSAIVPDTRADFVAPLKAGAFTASKFQYKFIDGMLVDYNVTQPSEIGAIADIPIKLVNNIMSIPGSILKFRFDFASAESKLIAEQTARLKAQNDQAVAIINMRSALETARATLANAPLADATARVNAIKALREAQQALEELKSSTKSSAP